MIIESGVIMFVGLLLLFMKLPRLLALRLPGQPLALDLVVSVAAYSLHWGTFSGVMAAAGARLRTMKMREKSRAWRLFIVGDGGGGGNRTRVRKRYTVRTTCLVTSLCSRSGAADGQATTMPVT